ncbi:transcriptional regulator [Schaalia meyeri]|uniref:LCP family protein n=1 Tax=Schaalia meyeri TaxID=52773 RepID=A0AAP9Y6X5_9ACTO|nr:LCP family protein [Schaalia meyeri]AKU64583.1 transcriptional regulator [Schaalia meyeri]OFQ24813.1 transcriptional regulator [Actinomyces sp. HMSC062G12]QQC43200.1 LCP family protein [Schaalia meyeri]SDS05982.1 cell envelope-related function transcriptional attenuator common domain-containing protein [Schaalia meyeri]
MSTPPSFRPDPARRRPGSDDVHVVGEEVRGGAPAPPPEALAPRMWRINEEEADASHPLMPRTLDQPKRRPTPRGPRRSTPEQAPPSFRPSSASIPPSYTPSGSGQNQAQARPPQSAPVSPLPPAAPPVPAATPRRKRRHPILKTLCFLLVLLLAWGAFLLWDANTNMGRVSALSGGTNTPGTTYLLAGSDSRADGAVQDGFDESERADSIMLVNVAPNGQAVALSIPRDTYAQIPGVGWDKINASYAYGGPQLLVETVEKLTGLTVDHFVQIGMAAVPGMVDAVGGVTLCYDNDADDAYSGLTWTAGCHSVDGKTALQFSRMRYQDPEGDIGRTKRQRQVISKVISAAVSPSTLVNPAKTLRVERAGSKSFTVDEDSSVFTVAALVMALRSASSHQLMGVPPIESLNYTTSAGGSAVLLRDTTADDFFAKLRSGTLVSSDLNQVDGL